MLNWFKPTWMINSIYRISPRRLERHGIRAVFSDLDNTLLAWNNSRGTLRIRKLQRELALAHVRLVVISNNTHRRVSRALSGLNLDFIDWSLKPLPFGIWRALKKYHLSNDQVVMVGDQLLTDIWAANNARVKSIWVKPLVNTDKWNTRINRYFEQKIKVRLERKYSNLHWRDDIDE